MAQPLYKDTRMDVSRAVDDIRRGELALPELQRPFVWSAAKVRDLLDSMYRGYPVGSLLIWATGAEPDARQIGGDTKDPVPRLLIIDGQQRLTALYAVLTGAPVLRADFTRGPIRIAFRPTDGTFAVADAAVEKDPEYLANISVLWEPKKLKPVTREFLARVRDKRKAVGGDVGDEEFDRLETAIDDLYNLQAYNFNVVELSAAIAEEEVAEVFVRINSAGAKLSQADFILTLMSVYWEDGRRGLERFCDAARTPKPGVASSFNWHIHPTPDQLLRVTTALALRRAVLKQVYAILRGREAGGTLSAELRTEQFGKLTAAQDKVLDLTNWHEFMSCLERAGFRGGGMISSQNAVLYSYVMWLIGRVEYGVPLNALREAITRWFFMAHTTGRYSGSFESRVEQDFARLHDVPAGDGAAYLAALDRIVDDTFTADYWKITLPNQLEASSAKSPAQLAYLAALNILDADALLSKVKVRTRMDPAVVTRKGIERHHLFPRNHLKQTGVREPSRINQIANLALAEWNDNIGISDRAPEDYWPALVAANHVSEDDLARQRYWHALPVGWETMPYEEFLRERRILIAEVVRDAFGKLRESGYVADYPPPVVAELPVQRTSEGRVTVAQLVDAGLLKPGTRLTLKRRDVDGEAVVDGAGNVVVDGTAYASPSPAAQVFTGHNVGGWGVWIAHTDAGPVLLDELRTQFRESAD